MKKFLSVALALAALCALVLAIWLYFALSHLPDVSVLKRYRPAAAAEVLDRDGRILTEYFDRKFRIWIPIASLPDTVIHAVVTAEDDTFFEHKGVNYKATWDALLLDMRKRRFARGGSTITQQMIKNVLLTREKTIIRKLREYVLARKAEELLTKRQILQIYLNEVEWGDNIYGIEAASRYYLDKHASELSPAEAALLAGMLPNPRYFNPFKRPDKAKKRQDKVLFNMFQAHLISDEEYEAGLRGLPPLREEQSARFSVPSANAAAGKERYQDALEQILLDLFGEQNLYRSGWTIRTTLDKNLQDVMGRLEDAPAAAPHVPDEVTLILEGDQVRAIVCSPGKEELINERLSSFGLSAGYSVVSRPLDSVAREQIIVEIQGERKDPGGSREPRKKPKPGSV